MRLYIKEDFDILDSLNTENTESDRLPEWPS